MLDGRGDASTLRPFGGILTEVNNLRSLPLQLTARNTEAGALLWVLKPVSAGGNSPEFLISRADLRFVLPNLVSIDGESQPQVSLANALPWQLQSSVFSNVGLLIASVTQSLDQGVELKGQMLPLLSGT